MAGGLSYLPAKALLTLESLQELSCFMMLKLEGRSVQSQPELLDELIKTRLVLEKLRPLDSKLQYQMEKMCKLAMAQSQTVEPNQPAAGTEDPLQLRPRPELFDKTLTVEESQLHRLAKGKTDDEKPAIYRPAKLNPVHFEDKAEKKAKHTLDKKKSRLARSEMIREMRREAAGAPAEISMKPVFERMLADEDKDREKHEENIMHRVGFTREEKRRRKAKVRDAMHETATGNSDYKIMEEIVSMQEDRVTKEKERQEQNVKLRKMVKTYNKPGGRRGGRGGSSGGRSEGRDRSASKPWKRRKAGE